MGIQAGRLSGDLVCVDIDSGDALARADDFLPATGLVEGRAGKPRSHRWFQVVDIPPQWSATCAGGIGGPQTLHFNGADRKSVVDFLGTGTQAVVPASLWTSKDGTQQEPRVWHSFGEPATLGFVELLAAVARFAAAFGGHNSRWDSVANPKPARRKSRDTRGGEELPDLQMPSGDTARQARNYVWKMPPAIVGQGGDRQTFTVACVLVRDFDLDPDEALPILLEYNRRCEPHWSLAELRHKLEEADRDDSERGDKVRPSWRKVDLAVASGEVEVLVGVGCRRQGRPFVELSPSLRAGLVMDRGRRVLAPELEAVHWGGRRVVLAPPSTVASNKQEVWAEYFLATEFRRRGALVESLRVPVADRRRTLDDLERPQDAAVVIPPATSDEARSRAEAASEMAARLASKRRSLPRRRRSPKVDQAIEFLHSRGAWSLSKGVLAAAAAEGLSRSTLKRAMAELRSTPPPGCCPLEGSA